MSSYVSCVGILMLVFFLYCVDIQFVGIAVSLHFYACYEYLCIMCCDAGVIIHVSCIMTLVVGIYVLCVGTYPVRIYMMCVGIRVVGWDTCCWYVCIVCWYTCVSISVSCVGI